MLIPKGLKDVVEDVKEFAKIITNTANSTILNLRRIYPATFTRTSIHEEGGGMRQEIKEWASAECDGLERLFEEGGNDNT